MRSVTLVGILAITSGCAAVDSDLQYRGTLDTQTNGIVLFEDGESGHAAMSATTCVIDPDGGIADDVDIEGSDDEAVLDGSNQDGATVLARTRTTLQVIQPAMDDAFSFGNRPDPRITQVIEIENVADARLLDDGFVALADCGVQFIDADGTVPETSMFELQGCTGMDPTFDVDRAARTAYIGTTEGLVSVSELGGVTQLGHTADLIEFSPDADGLILANEGGSDVRLMNVDGGIRWASPVPGTVVDVADLGARGSVAVMLEVDGAGMLALLNTETGELERSFNLPGRADIVTSANGRTIALVVDKAVHYYNLR